MAACVNGCVCEWLSVQVAVCANGCMCKQLSVQLAACANGCMCKQLRVQMAACVNGCVCKRLHVLVTECANGCVCKQQAGRGGELTCVLCAPMEMRGCRGCACAQVCKCVGRATAAPSPNCLLPSFPPPSRAHCRPPPLHPGAVVLLWVVGTRGCPQGAHEGAVLVTPARSAGVALGTVVSPQWFVSPPHWWAVGPGCGCVTAVSHSGGLHVLCMGCSASSTKGADRGGGPAWPCHNESMRPHRETSPRGGVPHRSVPPGLRGQAGKALPAVPKVTFPCSSPA